MRNNKYVIYHEEKHGGITIRGKTYIVLVILDMGDRIESTENILRWYAKNYGFDYEKLMCSQSDMLQYPQTRRLMHSPVFES